MNIDEYDITKYGFVQAQLKINLPPIFNDYRNIIYNISNQDGLFYRKLVDELEKRSNEYYLGLLENLSNDEIKEVYRTFSFMPKIHLVYEQR